MIARFLMPFMTLVTVVKARQRCVPISVVSVRGIYR